MLTTDEHVQIMRTTSRHRRPGSEVPTQIDPPTPLPPIEEAMDQLVLMLAPNKHIQHMWTTRGDRRPSCFVRGPLDRHIVDLEAHDEASRDGGDYGQLPIAPDARAVIERPVTHRVAVVMCKCLPDGQRRRCSQLERWPRAAEVGFPPRPRVVFGGEFVHDHAFRRDSDRAGIRRRVARVARGEPAVPSVASGSGLDEERAVRPSCLHPDAHHSRRRRRSQAEGLQGVAAGTRVKGHGAGIEPAQLQLGVRGQMGGAGTVHLLEGTQPCLSRVVEVAKPGGDVNHLHRPRAHRIVPHEPAPTPCPVRLPRRVEVEPPRRCHPPSVSAPVGRVDHGDVVEEVGVRMCLNGEARGVHPSGEVRQDDRARHSRIDRGATIRDRTEVRQDRPVIPRDGIRIVEDPILDEGLVVRRRRVVPGRAFHHERNEQVPRRTDP